jgi:hypothetical protein
MKIIETDLNDGIYWFRQKSPSVLRRGLGQLTSFINILVLVQDVIRVRL